MTNPFIFDIIITHVYSPHKLPLLVSPSFHTQYAYGLQIELCQNWCHISTPFINCDMWYELWFALMD